MVCRRPLGLLVGNRTEEGMMWFRENFSQIMIGEQCMMVVDVRSG